jgi:hypothetical protein
MEAGGCRRCVVRPLCAEETDMKNRLALGFAGVLVFAAAQSASAHILHYKIDLRGSSVLPPNSSENFGFGDLYFNEHSGTYNMFVEVVGIKIEDLTGSGPNSTPFHFHFGSKTEHGPMSSDAGWEVLFGPGGGQLTPTASGFRISLPDGLIYGTQGNFNADQLDNLFAFWEQRQWMDIHTKAFPDGELRGQWVDVTPSPGGLMLIGLASVAANRRRR